MEARVRVAGIKTEAIDVCNGLRQGCVMAPVLFNLYLTLVLERWGMAMEDVDPAAGIELMFNINGDLFLSSRRRRAPSRAFLSDF